MKTLQDYMEEKQTALFEQTGSFFAFGNEQYEKKARQRVEYYSMGHGLICPKENAKQLIQGLDEIYENAIRRDVEENGAEKIIEREYFNHETQISGDLSNAIKAIEGHKKRFPDLFTDEIINQVMKHCFKLAVENDWF